MCYSRVLFIETHCKPKASQVENTQHTWPVAHHSSAAVCCRDQAMSLMVATDRAEYLIMNCCPEPRAAWLLFLQSTMHHFYIQSKSPESDHPHSGAICVFTCCCQLNLRDTPKTHILKTWAPAWCSWEVERCQKAGVQRSSGH